tara:strand:- start:710 stop:1030 length:321 start_codon:yes stop_codon:yes gene_type:complete
MKKFKKIIPLILILFSAGCGVLKEGFTNQKKNSSDEFLVEKKSPLVMPPDYSELPFPKTYKNQIEVKENEIKTLITNQAEKNIKSDNDRAINKDIEELLLKKIKNQ